MDLEALEALIKWRNDVGVLTSNAFIFAAPTKKSKKFIRGNSALTTVLSKIDGLSNPDAIRSTEVRKYCATITQIAGLDELDLRWLADHMGHDVTVHREYYRIAQSTINITKTARLLMAIDQGAAERFVGKQLSDIDIEGECA